MPHLFGYVVYDVDLYGHEPRGHALVELTQQNPLLDAQRQVLATEFPRRRFETELSVTVGGLRAGKGTYYTGRQRSVGLDKLGELQSAHKLGLVNSFHLISKVFDRDDSSRDEATFVQIGADFTRPQASEYPAESKVHLSAQGAFGERHLDGLVAGAWQTFTQLVEIAPVKAAYAAWDGQTDYYRAKDQPPVAAFMLLGGATIARLGGATSAASSLGAFEWTAVRGDEGNGVVMQLGRRPEDTTGQRLADIRSRLRAAT